MSTVDQLLRNRPKILKGSQHLIQNKPSSDFSLNLDRALFTVQKAPRLIRPTELQVETSTKVYEDQIEQIEITEKEFEKLIPKKQKDHPIINKPIIKEDKSIPLYVREQEQTKKFIMETLSEELARLDKNTEQLVKDLEEQKQKAGLMKEKNDEIEVEVKQMVQAKRLENRISQLEDQINVPKELKLNLINADWNIVNEQIEQMLKDNQDLYDEADQIAHEFAKQQLIDNEDIV